MEMMYDLFVKGVNVDTDDYRPNGGPKCASESTFEFKLIFIVVFTPYYLYILNKGYNLIKSQHKTRQLTLAKQGISIYPSAMEQIQGLLCLFTLAYNAYLKVQSGSLIFILNPCHLVTLCVAICSLFPFSVFTELCAIFVFSSTYGGWIGIIFSENDELGNLEIFVYYLEHLFTSFLGVLIFFINGRFNPLKYFEHPIPVFGFVMFCSYMRYILTPLSAATWVNLNHTLCGVDNDPFYALLKLDKWYYPLADFYLLFSCYVGIYLNNGICCIFKVLFCKKKQIVKQE